MQNVCEEESSDREKVKSSAFWIVNSNLDRVLRFAIS